MSELIFSRLVAALARFLPWAGAAIAAVIFALGMKSAPKVAVGALYLAAVLVAGRFCRTNGVVLTALWCACLILLGSYFEPENPVSEGIRISAIGIGTFLVLKAQSVEESARQSEAEWREVFEHNPVMYFMVDPAGIILSVNSYGAAALGYRVEELVGQSVLKICPGSDQEGVRRNLDLCLERLGQANTWESEKTRKDGTTLWVRENAKAIQRANGDVVVLIACEDITERRRAEEAVREAAKRSRALIEHAFDAVLLMDQDSSILYASPSIERVLGYQPMEIVGRNALNFVHPEHVSDLGNRLLEAQRHGSVAASEQLVSHKHGNWLWIESTLTNLLAEPSVRAFVLNLRDIDARKRAETALRESEHRFRDYAETASDWFWETGPDHRFTELSYQAPFAASGIGMTRWDIAADLDENPQKWRDHRAVLNAREPFRAFTYKARGADGSFVFISVSGKPLFDRDGRFLGYRGVATDVSDKVRADNAERALHETRMTLAHVARITSLGELTASIAHEVNQPLTAVLMFAGTASRWLSVDPPNIEEARKALASITRDGRRAGDVIGRIRALAKKESILMDRFEINDAIREVIALTRSEIDRHRVALNAKLVDPAPTILGDRVQFQQVLLNLILNAVEAMDERERRELSIETRMDDERHVLVSVSDSGSGIDPANADRVFEPFFSTKPGGMGIGLSICRSIVESHGGKIWARSTNEGSTFEFVIPLSDAKAN